MLCAVLSGFAADKPIRRNSKIFIEPMEGGLDGYIRAEIVKQKVPLVVVMSRGEAHLVVLGAASLYESRSWHEGVLTAEKDHAVGNLSVFDRTTGLMVWAAEAGDRNFLLGPIAGGGLKKVAGRIVSRMKNAVDPKLEPQSSPPPLTAKEIAAGSQSPATSDGSGSPNHPALTNDDIVKLVRAKLSDNLVIQTIRRGRPGFNLDADSLVALKQAGVSEKVIAAMIERQKH